MRQSYCLRCAKPIAHDEPRLCFDCGLALERKFATPGTTLVETNYDQACVECGAFEGSRLLHSPGEFTWCEACVEAAIARGRLAGEEE